MKKAFVLILYLTLFIIYPSANVFAVEVAPLISDREIIEKLARLEEGQNAIITGRRCHCHEGNYLFMM